MHMITNPSSRDHAEVDLGPAAGVSDRGLRHHRNEDAMALAAEQAPDGPAVVAVVCDGVSSSARPDQASLVAAEAALPVLVTAAIARGYEVTLCWLGDSRAYWLAESAPESRPLTRDDSVAGGMVAAGLVDEAAAMASPHAHVLTRWLGGEEADLADDPERAPHVERFAPPGAGSLLICSDGLWNYRPEAADLAALALPKALTDPLGAAADMVKFAIEAGGADNITVVLVPYLGPEPS